MLWEEKMRVSTMSKCRERKVTLGGYFYVESHIQCIC